MRCAVAVDDGGCIIVIREAEETRQVEYCKVELCSALFEQVGKVIALPACAVYSVRLPDFILIRAVRIVPAKVRVDHSKQDVAFDKAVITPAELRRDPWEVITVIGKIIIFVKPVINRVCDVMIARDRIELREYPAIIITYHAVKRGVCFVKVIACCDYELRLIASDKSCNLCLIAVGAAEVADDCKLLCLNIAGYEDQDDADDCFHLGVSCVFWDKNLAVKQTMIKFIILWFVQFSVKRQLLKIFQRDQRLLRFPFVPAPVATARAQNEGEVFSYIKDL